MTIEPSTPFLELTYRNPSFPGLEIETFSLGDLRERLSARYYERIQRLHFHLLFLYTLGQGRHEVDFVPIECKRGTLIHVRPGQVQRYLDIHGLDGQVVFFTSTFLLPKGGGEAQVPSESRFLPATEPVTALNLDEPALGDFLAGFDVIRREYDKTDGGKVSATILRFQLQALMLQIQRATQPRDSGEHSEAGQRKLFLKFNQLVESRFAVTRTVEDYAQLLGCSPRTLNRAALAFSGMSAKQYIDQRVTLEAKRLLAHTTLSVGQISRALGFSEPTNFVKFFRRETGGLPGLFRDDYV